MHNFLALDTAAWLSSAGATFLLITLAEFGDKSQLVCMTLAAKHRSVPVLLGAVAAFAILNLLAVLFGAALAAWLPEWLITVVVAILFAVFGISALRYQDEEEDENIEEKPGHSVFATTFLLIFIAEFGDKTQIAVAGMGSTSEATAVWVGGTIALAFTSALGVFAGSKLLKQLPLLWIHRISGIFFLLLAAFALSRLL